MTCACRCPASSEAAAAAASVSSASALFNQCYVTDRWVCSDKPTQVTTHQPSPVLCWPRIFQRNAAAAQIARIIRVQTRRICMSNGCSNPIYFMCAVRCAAASRSHANPVRSKLYSAQRTTGCVVGANSGYTTDTYYCVNRTRTCAIFPESGRSVAQK